MPTNNTTYIINTLELPKSGGAAFIPTGLDPALVSGAPGTAAAGTWSDGPMGNFPSPGGVLLPSFPDRPSAERTACANGNAVIDSVAPATFSHLAGAALTIKGSRFTGATAAGVQVGGVACTNVVVVNDSTITAVSPLVGTGPAASYVTVNNGTAASPQFAVSLT